MSCWQSGQRCRVLDGRPSLGEPKPPIAERLNPATDLFRTNEANLDTGRSSRARLFPGSVLVTEIRYGILLPDPGEKAFALLRGMKLEALSESAQMIGAANSLSDTRGGADRRGGITGSGSPVRLIPGVRLRR